MFLTFDFGVELVFRIMFYNCTDVAMNAVRSFSQDGKMKYSAKKETSGF